MCLLQQQASKQDISTQYQGKQQVCSIRVHPVLHHRSREGLQLDAGHNAPESQRKNRDVILGNEDLEDLWPVWMLKNGGGVE